MVILAFAIIAALCFGFTIFKSGYTVASIGTHYAILFSLAIYVCEMFVSLYYVYRTKDKSPADRNVM
eukprot:Awhi_evm1s5015